MITITELLSVNRFVYATASREPEKKGMSGGQEYQAEEAVMLARDWLGNETKVTTACVIMSALSLVLSFGGWLAPVLPFDAAWPAIILCGIPILVGAIRGLVQDHDVTADVLVALALVASVATRQWFAAGEVGAIMQIGSLLEDYTSGKAREGVEAMARLLPHNAHLMRNGKQVDVPIEQVTVGDTVVILAGERVPVDGTVLEGSPSMDQSIMTGEGLPVDKTPGDTVISGTTNLGTPFTLRATSTSEASSMQRMVDLTREAEASKAPVVRLADRWASRLVAVALACAFAAWALSGEFMRAVTVLVVFCPCAFVLATPTAVAAGIANAAKHGVFVRSGESIERLAKVGRVALDKTGTLTQGKPRVVAVVPMDGLSKDELLSLAGAAESRSEHPLGRAVIEAANAKGALPEANDFEVLAGGGVAATVGNDSVLVGRRSLLVSHGINCADAQQTAERLSSDGSTVAYVAVAGKMAGLLAFSDTLRPDAKQAVADLHRMGIDTVLLTGDNEQAAHAVAAEVGISQVHAALKPEDKLREVSESGSATCMVGDGVNDAPALNAAYAGVSLGKIGSDVAVSSSDAVLMSDQIGRLPYTLAISRATMRKVRQSIGFGLAINFMAVVCSFLGLLTPVTAAIVHNCGSVFVVVNAALLLRAKPDKKSGRG